MGRDVERSRSAHAYGVAVLASVVALGATLLVWPRLETTPSPLFFAAVVVSSWYGGLRPAFVATALAALATSYFFVPPVHSIAIESLDDGLRLGLFVLVAVLTGSLSAARRRAEIERGQQASIAELGRLALAGGELSGLMHEAATHVARTLGIEYAAVWELSSGNRLPVLRAAVCCRKEIVADVVLDTDVLSAVAPEIDDSEHVANGNGVRLAKVIIRGSEGPLGILSTHVARPRRFSAGDAHFLQAVAHVLGEAMMRRRADEERTALLARERTARGRAEAASRAKEDLLATVSHELRAPLAQLVTWSRLLRLGRHDDTALDAVERSTRTLERLAGDLLDVSRISAGKLALSLRPTALADAVEAALDGVRPSAMTKGVGLEQDLAITPMELLADPTRLHQVVWNLVGNAIKFTPPAGRVVVRLRQIADRAELTVTDTGRGISAAFLPHVFEPFRQAGGATEGLGLGLAIVRQLVELHGGTVRAESPGEGRGARFTVVLPLLSAATDVFGGGSIAACGA